MGKFRNCTIPVSSVEESVAVQEALFNDGAHTFSSLNKVTRTPWNVICVMQSGLIQFSSNSSFRMGALLNASEVIQAFKADILSKPSSAIISKGKNDSEVLIPYIDVRVAWANGKTVQRRVDGGKWVDWAGFEAINIGDGLCWRVKPEPKTMPVWHRNFLDQWGLVRIDSALKKDELGFSGHGSGCRWISEPYLVNHEVSE